jgi:hypothetical protein
MLWLQMVKWGTYSFNLKTMWTENVIGQKKAESKHQALSKEKMDETGAMPKYFPLKSPRCLAKETKF